MTLLSGVGKRKLDAYLELCKLDPEFPEGVLDPPVLNGKTADNSFLLGSNDDSSKYQAKHFCIDTRSRSHYPFSSTPHPLAHAFTNLATMPDSIRSGIAVIVALSLHVWTVS
jgi:hypothetical protein